MSHFVRAYGQGAIFPLSLLDAEGSPAGLVLEAGMIFAAADLVLRSDEIAATLTAESVAFTSGSIKPSVGDTLTGATSTETLVVVGVVLTSGTWAGNNAAGVLFVEQVSGAFQAEDLNNTTESDNNVMTIGGDIGGVAAAVVNNGVWVALTSTEMACKYGNVEVVDDTATQVWLDATFSFETYGNAAALHPVAQVQLEDGAITTPKFADNAITADKIATDAISAAKLATDAVQEIRNAITGGAYALDTDANGRIRLVAGTGAGEITLTSGLVSADVKKVAGGNDLAVGGSDPASPIGVS